MIQFDPMADGGCPQCKWIGDAYGSHLAETCELHTKIAEISADLGWTREAANSSGRVLCEVVKILGGNVDDDDPVELAKMRMEELIAADAA